MVASHPPLIYLIFKLFYNIISIIIIDKGSGNLRRYPVLTNKLFCL